MVFYTVGNYLFENQSKLHASLNACPILKDEVSNLYENLMWFVMSNKHAK